MFCQSCGSRIGDHDRFCSVCGAIVPASGAPHPDAAGAPEYVAAPTQVYGGTPTQVYGGTPTQVYGGTPTQVYGSDPTQVYGSDPTQVYGVTEQTAGPAPVEQENMTVVVDPWSDRYAEPLNPDNPYPIGSSQQQQPPVDYQDSFEIRNTPRFQESNWQDPSRSKKKQYRKTTAGRRIASIFVCLLFLLFSFLALIIGTCRIALSESKVRSAYNKGTLADLKIDTDEGEKTLAQILMDNVVDADTNLPIPLEGKAVNRFLQGSRINAFVENLVVDFTQFFIFGRTPSLLNGTAISEFMSSISDEINNEISYSMSDEDIRYIGRRVDGGDLSFLSIDKNGGYFKQKYGVDPNMISSLFSVWVLSISAGLALICVVLVFVINHQNLPAGLSFNGSAMIVFGVLNTLIAASLLILSFIKDIFLLSELLRGFALAMGGISIAVLVIGIIFAVIKSVLKNRI